MGAILIGIGVVFALLFLTTKKGRALLGGFIHLFIEDTAKTPKGAEAIYTKAIEEQQTKYAKASDNYKKITGSLHTAMNKRKEFERVIQDCERRCVELMKIGNREDARIYADRKIQAENSIKVYDKQIETYTKMSEQAKEIVEHTENEIYKLKNEKEIVVRSLELNVNAKSMYDDLDDLRKSTGARQLLDSVKEGLEEAEGLAYGSKLLYDNKIENRMRAVDKKIESAEVEDYLDSLIDKDSKF